MIRIGLIGTGRIATRFVSEIKHVEGITLNTVFNPNKKSAEAFAIKHGIGHFSSDIDSFMKSVDAVYVASPHDSHEKYTEYSLRNGKHVLCEKPMALSKDNAKRLYSYARSNRLVLIEAVKTAFCPGFAKICEIVNSGKIGRVIDVEASFSKLTSIEKREFQDTQCGGSFTELGSFVLLPAFRLLGTEYEEVRFDPFFMANGVDGYTKVSLSYPDGTSATCKTGLSAKTEGELVIAGTRGYIYVPAPWWLTKRFEVRGENPNASKVYECEFEESGLRYEIKAFTDLIEGVESFDTELLEKESLAKAALMEGFLKRRIKDPMHSEKKPDIGIWAHRGASYDYPENTIPAFLAAAKMEGIRGIEMDIQRTADGQIVVFHDETLDRVMEDGSGRLCDHTLAQLQARKMKGTEDKEAYVPTLDEFLYKMRPFCEAKGMLINIELKTSVIRYEGIEREAYDIVRTHNMEQYIVWSSFLDDSIRIIKEIDPDAETGMLGNGMHEIVRQGDAAGCDAYHTWDNGLEEADMYLMRDIEAMEKPIRAWTGAEPLFVNRSSRALPVFDRRRLKEWGVTDIFTNVPDRYLGIR